jgi:hypothetical protein
MRQNQLNRIFAPSNSYSTLISPWLATDIFEPKTWQEVCQFSYMFSAAVLKPDRIRWMHVKIWELQKIWVAEQEDDTDVSVGVEERY